VVDVTDASDEFAITFPPNARMSALEFGHREVRVFLADGGSERIVPAASIAAIHGAAIRREALHPAPLDGANLMEKMMGKERVAVNEQLQYVVALRAASVGELWYLVADTFNFRKTLGPQTGYILDQNLRLFLRKLTDVAPQAVQDGFVTATLANLPLPPPIDSLMEFFRIVSR
jgi:hypothetical protein